MDRFEEPFNLIRRTLMKRSFFLSSLVVALAWTAGGQSTVPGTVPYTNDSVVVCPPNPEPQIDSEYFVNNSYFEVVFTNLSLNAQLFTTVDTLHYINHGYMSLDPGLDFETLPSLAVGGQAARSHPAAEFINTGGIAIGTETNLYTISTNAIVSFYYPKGIVAATNIQNSGSMALGYNGVLSLDGENVDLRRGSIVMTNYGFSLTSLGGGFFGFLNNFSTGNIFDGYWGIGTNFFNPYDWFVLFKPPTTPAHVVTERGNGQFVQELVLNNNLSYGAEYIFGSNDVRHVAYVSNTNGAYAPNVYIYYNAIVLEWVQTLTNADGTTRPSYLYVEDFLTDFPTTALAIDGFAGVAGTSPTYIPENYAVFQTGARQSDPAVLFGAMTIPASYVLNASGSNVWTAYQALIPPISTILSDVVGQDVTNIPGRVEINGSGALDLGLAHITAQNYVSLKATNQFLGSSLAQISAPFSDINLRSTNGLLTVTNLVESSVVQPEGYINLYSTCQTNVDAAGFTNIYHILAVDAHLSPLVNARVQDLTLRVTNTAGGDDNLVINDALNITRSYLLDASRITLATNAPGSPTACGALNIENDSVLWSALTPRLQYLTNYGSIQSLNAVFFGGSRSSPYYSSAYQEPYQAFVNQGGVTNSGTFIWARSFVNGGTFCARLGDIQLDHAQNAVLTSGVFQALSGTISLKSSYLLASSNLFESAGLALSVTNVLTDGVTNLASIDLSVTNAWPTNGNYWVVGSGGINLSVTPGAGDLLGTTITNAAPANAVTPIVWAGRDLGNDVAGFNNNAALGRLVLVGGDSHTVFKFSAPPGTSGALYVDSLEFAGATATTLDVNNNYIGVQIAPQMKVYYAQALVNGVSIAEKLNGLNGGGFIWVSNYDQGYFSSTNKAYPDGKTYRLNAALAASTDLDSNGDGVVNAADPAPIPINNLETNANSVPWLPLVDQQPASQTNSVGATVSFAVTLTNTPGPVTYQWMFRSYNSAAVLVAEPIPGQTNSTYTITNAQWADRGAYSVVVRNAYGSILSADGELTVWIPPLITTQPQSQTVMTNDSATFQVSAVGNPQPAYQWRLNGVNLIDATSPTYTIAGARTSDAGSYDVVITNLDGVVTSQVATLTVLLTSPPFVSAQPANQVVAANSNATFRVTANGTMPLSYQWRFNGVNLPNATRASYTVAAAQRDNDGSYVVVISNALGMVTSQIAGLSVISSIPSMQFPGAPLSSADAATNAFSSAAGTYNGLISDTNGVSARTSGSLSVRVNSKGGYSAKLSLGGRNYSVAGKLTSTNSTAIQRTGLSLFLQVNPTNAGGTVFGLVSGGEWTAQAVAYRSGFNAANPATNYQGAYTMVVPPCASNASGPAGYGYGTIKFDAAGNIRFSGALADGTKVSQSTTLSKGGYWPLFASLYKGAGCALSWMQNLKPLLGANTTGTALAPVATNGFFWVKNAGADAKNYTGGFTNAVGAQGVIFTPQRGTALPGLTNAAVVFSGGGVPTPFSNPFTLDVHNRVHRPTHSPLSLSVSASSGLFSGTTLDARGYKIRFQGVVSQQATNGFGYFLGNYSKSGVVELLQAP